MTPSFVDTPIEYLKGVGPSRAELLKSELNIFTFGELLTFFPFRYLDRSKFYRIADITGDSSYIQLKARMVRMQIIGAPRHQRLVATVRDESGEIDLIWFQGIKWVSEMLSARQEYVVFGKPSLFNGHWNISHPELEILPTEPVPLNEIIRPVYNSTEKLKSKGLDSRGIGKLIKGLILHEKFFISENITGEILLNLRLIDRQAAFLNVHFPRSPEILKK
ncbi:MAG: ATP-dependent DNA helicase RecG, partial [Bacteroidales bacterium]